MSDRKLMWLITLVLTGMFTVFAWRRGDEWAMVLQAALFGWSMRGLLAR